MDSCAQRETLALHKFSYKSFVFLAYLHVLQSAELLWRGRGKVGGRARDRSLGVQCTWLPPQASLSPQKHAYHGMYMILT